MLFDFLPDLGDLIDALIGPLTDLLGGIEDRITAVWKGIKGVLDQILCVLTSVGKYFLLGIVLGINKLIAAIGGLIGAMVALLPNMPSSPDWSGIPDHVFEIANWAFPFPVLITALGALATLWAVWQIVSIGLRWAKAE